MPDPYTITITSAAENINNTPETYQLILTLTVQLNAANETYSFADKSLVILNHGKTRWEHKIEDGLVTPASMDFVISDPTGYLRGLLFGTSAQEVATDKQFVVEVKLDGTNEFTGTAVEDGITATLINDSTVDSYLVKFVAYPRTDTMIKTMLYDGATALNPFTYTEDVFESLEDMITDLWQLVDGGITVDFSQEWIWAGEDVAGGYDEEDVTFDDLEVIPDHIYFDSSRSISNCGEALRMFAVDYGAYTGLIDETTAFFYSLFQYDAGNTQTLGTVLSKTEGYIFNLLDFIRIESVAPEAVNTSSGTFTEIEGRFIDYDFPIYVGLRSIGGVTSMNDVKSTLIGGTYANAEAHFCDWWFAFRGDITKLRTDEFEVVGVDYVFTKNFSHNSFKYQILELEKNWETGTSKIKALNLGT